SALRPTRSEELFDEHRQLFDAVLPFFSARGRLPSVKELPNSALLYQAIPRIDLILRALERALGDDVFSRVVSERRQDLLVYLALSRFNKRPPLQRLPEDLQLDIRSLFPSYRAACVAADELLFRLGDRMTLETAFAQPPVGKLTPN